MSPSRVFGGDLRTTIPITPNAPLRIHGTTSRPKLGLSIQDTDDGKGVKVLDVAEEGNAAKAGIKEGDIITHVDDKAVNSTDEITRHIRDGKDKAGFQLKVVRNGKSQNIEVKFPRTLKKADL
jgi:serine protease Do